MKQLVQLQLFLTTFIALESVEKPIGTNEALECIFSNAAMNSRQTYWYSRKFLFWIIGNCEADCDLLMCLDLHIGYVDQFM